MNRRSVSILLFVLLALSGCASFLKQVTPGEQVVIGENEALIFGKIIFIENDEVKVPYGLLQVPMGEIVQIESGADRRFRVQRRDGGFYLIVPVGSYNISFIEFPCDYSIEPQLTQIEVPSGGIALYLGTINIDVNIGKFPLWGGRIKKINRINVRDDFETAKKAILSCNPDLKIEKKLMTIMPDTSPTMKNLYCPVIPW